jgi:hypothetical protein
MKLREKLEGDNRAEWLATVAACVRSTRFIAKLVPPESDLERELVGTVDALCGLMDELLADAGAVVAGDESRVPIGKLFECKLCRQLREMDSEFCAHHANGEVKASDYREPT